MNRWRQSIATRLVGYILLVSSVFTLAATGLQLGLEFRRDRVAVEGQLEQITESHVPALLEAAWAADLTQLDVLLDGVASLPDIESAEVRLIGGEVVSTPPSSAGQQMTTRWDLSRMHRGESIQLGELVVVGTLDHAVARLRSRVALILATQFLKTLLVSFFIVMIFHRLVARHLRHLADQLRDIDGTSLDQTISLARDRTADEADELGVVVESVNFMRERLRTTYARLVSHQEELASEVKLRTAELEEANQALRREVADRQRRAGELVRALELAEHANSAKSEFVSRMSHELRTPLNAIIGYTEMTRESLEELDDAQMVEDTSRVLKASQHLLSLINDLLDVSKIEAGELVLDRQEFSVRELLQDVEHTSAPLAAARGLQLEVNPDDDLGSMVGDPRRLGQVLVNLTANAIKFTDSGVVNVQAQSAEGRVQFRVTDSGIGMTADQVANAFEAFAQADAVGRRGVTGTGLGLTISRALVERMGGRISASSTLGKGSEFTVEMPRQTPAG